MTAPRSSGNALAALQQQMTAPATEGVGRICYDSLQVHRVAKHWLLGSMLHVVPCTAKMSAAVFRAQGCQSPPSPPNLASRRQPKKLRHNMQDICVCKCWGHQHMHRVYGCQTDYKGDTCLCLSLHNTLQPYQHTLTHTHTRYTKQ